MTEEYEPRWLVLDGYEDEPAAFGVPPYVGFTFVTCVGFWKRQRLIIGT